MKTTSGGKEVRDAVPHDYERDAAVNPLWGSPREQALAERILKAVPRDTRSLLDVGCGDGYLLHEAALRFPSLRLTGVDLSEARLERTRAAVPRAIAVKAVVEDLPFSDGAFDVVTCSEVLEHVAEPAVALRSLWRVTGRRLIVTVPNDQPVVPLDCPHCSGRFFLSGHLHRLDVAGLGAMAGLLPGVRSVRLGTFHTIFTYNRVTFAWPQPLRMAVDRAATALASRVSFLKGNFLILIVEKR